MNIRTAVISDFDGITALEKQVFDLHYRARPDIIGREKMPLGPADFKKRLADKDCRIFVAEEQDALAGFCVLQKKRITDHPVLSDMEYIEIEDLCVDKNRQNRGTGKKLFEWAAAYAKAEGINRMELSVWAFNKNAAGFYEHLGMQTRTSRMEITL